MGTPPERNWRGVLQPSYLLRKANDDVDKFSEAQGALKQAMCSMSVSREQVRTGREGRQGEGRESRAEGVGGGMEFRREVRGRGI